jgi:hypothetical protein
MGLRERVRRDCKILNNRDWGMPVILISPDGVTYDKDHVTGLQLKAAQILYDYTRVNPNTGEDILVNEPVVVIHRDSLARIPLPGENWIVKIPLNANSTTLTDYILTASRSPEGGQSIGFIRLYPQLAEQAEEIDT